MLKTIAYYVHSNYNILTQTRPNLNIPEYTNITSHFKFDVIHKIESQDKFTTKVYTQQTNTKDWI